MKHGLVKTIVLVLFIVLAFTPLCRAQTQIAGDWQGTLRLLGKDYRFILHVTTAQDGRLKATADDPDEDHYAMPVDVITLKGSKLDFTISIAHASYSGTVNNDITEIDGIYTSHMILKPKLILKRVPVKTEPTHGEVPLPASPVADSTARPNHPLKTPSTIAGDWYGLMNIQDHVYHPVLHISIAADGTLKATADDPEDNALNLPVETITLIDSKLYLTVTTVNGTYEGTVNKDATEIVGTWSQDYVSDLNFKRTPVSMVDTH